MPGLAENRPSVMYGDAVYVTFEDYEYRHLNDFNFYHVFFGFLFDKGRYQGIVHKVEEEVVHLKFDRRFHDRFDVNRAYQVHFYSNI